MTPLESLLGQGLGAWAVLYDVTDPAQLKFEHTAQRNLPPGLFELMAAGAATVARKDAESTFLTKPCGTLSESLAPKFTKRNHVAKAAQEAFGIADGLGINAMDPTLRGCILAVFLKKPRKTSRDFRGRWSRIAAHIAAGRRLRRQLDGAASSLVDGAEAVLDPDGSVQHADGEAKGAAARAALRGAVVSLDRLRTERVRRADADGAIEGWKGLVDGRWSLVDHFDRDGRRYVVARRNDPQVDAKALSQRELQVLAFAALGHANKLIGYELGLSESSVATHLMRAGRKLGLKSRVAMIRAFKSGLAAA